jgi:phage/plasmid-associated DNA primase
LEIIESYDDISDTYYPVFKKYVLNREQCLLRWNQYYELDYKQEVISILFNGTHHPMGHPDLVSMKSEIKTVSILLKDKLTPWFEKNKLKWKTNNELGSMISRIVFYMERMIIDLLLVHLKENTTVLQYKDKLVFTYEFDGIKLLKENIENIDSFIEEINAFIHTSYPYISFTNKEYKEYLELPETLYQIKDIKDSSMNQETMDKIFHFQYTPSDRDIVLLIREIYDKRILYSEKEIAWYFYDIRKKRWSRHNEKNPPCIKTLLYEDVLAYLNKYFEVDDFREFCEEVSQPYEDIEQKPAFLKKLMRIQEILYLLSSNKNTNQIIDYLKAHSGYLFNEMNVEFDADEFLLGFNNGVYDLRSMEFREASYEDFVSMSVGYDFTLDRNAEKENELMNIFKRIHPEEETLNLWLSMYASMLCGLNIEKFFILQGHGRNGKGFMNEFMAHTLGNHYIYYCEPSLLTHKFDTTSANPSLANIHKKRGIIIKEMDNNDKIINSNVKTLTGGGFINCRMLYSNECQAKQCATLICESNDDVMFKSNPKKAEIERIVVLMYNSSFLESVKEDDAENHLYRQDPFLKTIQWKEDYKMSFLHILLDYYKRLQHNDFKFSIPESIRNLSREYSQKSSILLSILNTHFEKEEHHKIEVKTFVNRIKEFAIDNKAFFTAIQIRSITKESVLKTLEDMNIPIQRGFVIGLKVKDEYDSGF